MEQGSVARGQAEGEIRGLVELDAKPPIYQLSLWLGLLGMAVVMLLLDNFVSLAVSSRMMIVNLSPGCVMIVNLLLV